MIEKNGSKLKMPPDSKPIIELRGPIRGSIRGWQQKEKCDIIELSEKERKLIECLRKIAYGEVTIFMQDGQPVRIEQMKESVKL